MIKQKVSFPTYRRKRHFSFLVQLPKLFYQIVVKLGAVGIFIAGKPIAVKEQGNVFLLLEILFKLLFGLAGSQGLVEAVALLHTVLDVLDEDVTHSLVIVGQVLPLGNLVNTYTTGTLSKIEDEAVLIVGVAEASPQ